MATQYNDPMDAASKATLRPSYFFGQLGVDTFFCALVKGQGKVPFDASAHDESQRRVSVNLTLTTMPNQVGDVRTFERPMIAESVEWVKVTNPSITALGLTLKDVKDKYVMLTSVPTGRKYEVTSALDGSKEMREATAWKILKVFATGEECQAAADALFGRSDTGFAGNKYDQPDAASYDPATMHPTEAPAAAPAGNAAGKTTASMFLAPLWVAAKKDVTQYAALIAGNPLVAAHFNINSPEVVAIVSAG